MPIKLLAVWSAMFSVAYACGSGTGGGPGDPRDVRGNYDVTYDNQLKATLYLGGAVREVTQAGYGGVIDFGVVNGQPVSIDLTAHCARPEVECPSESFWTRVSVDQPDLTRNNFDLQGLQVIDNRVHNLPAGQKAAAAGGLVNHDNADRYVLGLGINGGANQACAALAVSFAHGRFTHAGESVTYVTEYRTPSGKACTPNDAGAAADAGSGDGGAPEPCNPVQVQKISYPAGAATNGIAEGKVVLGWAGGCAFGPILAGAVLIIETGYTGARTGEFDPPPYTPAEVVLPDGGYPDAGFCDGGSTDGGC
jgi:hypothetical protein